MPRKDTQPTSQSIGTAARLAFFGVGTLVILAIIAWLLGAGPNAQSPYQLEEMARIAQADISTARIREYAALVDSEYIWRLRVSPESLDAVIAHQQLTESDAVPTAFVSAFPLLWRPEKTNASRFFSTPQFPFTSRGPDGDHYAVMYDPENQQLYVWLKANF